MLSSLLCFAITASALPGGYVALGQDLLSGSFSGPPTRVGSTALPALNPANGKPYYCPNVVDLSCFTIDIVPSANLDQYLVPANAVNSPGLDPQFYGVWWLNNSEPTGLVTFSGLPVIQVNGSPRVQALSYGPEYVYDNTDHGKANWMESFIEDFKFDLEFFPNRTAIAHPNFIAIGEVSTYQGNFTFNYIDETHMQRVSQVQGKDVALGDYPVIRVMDGQGNKDAAWNEWVDYHATVTGSPYSLLGNKRSKWDFFKACGSICI